MPETVRPFVQEQKRTGPASVVRVWRSAAVQVLAMREKVQAPQRLEETLRVQAQRRRKQPIGS